MKQIVQEEIRQVVDTNTGEIVMETTSKTFTVNSNVEPFFMTFARYMAVLYQINSLSAVKVLWKLLENSKLDSAEVLIPTALKNSIIKDLEISRSSYDKAISLLLKLGILTSYNRGIAVLNAAIHWKGSTKNRAALLNAKSKITVEPITEDTETEEKM